ncbi:hypothetical protein Ga0609869_001655 [Rhodovulum iodosum]|uniref:Hedgehog/Intein (Hint) domain-containing protein n=1 Tax=Rhodovulum iodosum TaxID=68291 RepID=A0ABV3XSK9_9RHOB|nr:Hint domain-containing protein [Rhodovulum robiginosum]RSK30623.1 hypothetical protein EJA01_17815 [Rhodovulum robiginosum]
MSLLQKIDPPGGGPAFPGGVAEGANLRTPCGPRRVEFVRNGDMIVTRTGGLQPVRLVWQRRLTADEVARHPDRAPVRLMPRALGPMMPQSALLVAPDHRLLIPGWRLAAWPDDRAALVPAREIAGTSDAAFIDRAPAAVTLYHFVFDSPQVLLVNGLPVESLAPGARVIAGLGLAERTSLFDRFPQLRKDPSAYPPAEYPSASGTDYLAVV